MFYRIKPPYNKGRLSIKRWYNRMLGYCPANWRDLPWVYVEDQQLPDVINSLYEPWPRPLRLKTFRP